MLAWSFNGDGQIDPALQSSFEKRHAPVTEKRRERQDLVSQAKPQQGVDALNGKFGRPTQSMAGVIDKPARR